MVCGEIMGLEMGVWETVSLGEGLERKGVTAWCGEVGVMSEA